MTRQLPQEWKNLPPILGTRDVAEMLGVHVNTIKNIIAKGNLPAFKIGRILKIHRTDVFSYVGIDTDCEDKGMA